MPGRTEKLLALSRSAFALSLPGTAARSSYEHPPFCGSQRALKPHGTRVTSYCAKGPRIAAVRARVVERAYCASRARFLPALPQISGCCSLLTPHPRLCTHVPAVW